jgi:hypothetical protein
MVIFWLILLYAILLAALSGFAVGALFWRAWCAYKADENVLLHEGWQLLGMNGKCPCAGCRRADRRYSTPELVLFTIVAPATIYILVTFVLYRA